MTARRPIRCDCCGTVVCAQHDGDRIVIRKRQHGRDHYAVVAVDKRSSTEENNRRKSVDTLEG